jgi:hypothetical protein
VANLLLMTPFYWSVDDDRRDRLAALDALDTEIDVVVQAYRRTGHHRRAAIHTTTTPTGRPPTTP